MENKDSLKKISYTTIDNISNRCCITSFIYFTSLCNLAHSNPSFWPIVAILYAHNVIFKCKLIRVFIDF